MSSVEDISNLEALAAMIVETFNEDRRIFTLDTLPLDCRFSTRYFKSVDGPKVTLSMKLKTNIHTSLPRCIEYLTRGEGMRKDCHERTLQNSKNKDVLRYPIKEIQSPMEVSVAQVLACRTSVVRSVSPGCPEGPPVDIETRLKFRLYEDCTTTGETVISFESVEEESSGDGPGDEGEDNNVDVAFSLCGPRRLAKVLGCYKLNQLPDGSTRIVMYLRLKSAKEIGKVVSVISNDLRPTQSSLTPASRQKALKSKFFDEKSTEKTRRTQRRNQKITQEVILLGCAHHVVEMWKYFEDSARIDEVRVNQFIKNIPNSPTLDAKELVLIRSMYKLTEQPKGTQETIFGFEGWTLTKGSLTPGNIKKSERNFIRKGGGDGSEQQQNLDAKTERWGMAKAVVDAAPEKLLAQLSDWNSNENMRKYIDEGETSSRQCVNLPGSRSCLTREYFGMLQKVAIETWFTWAQMLHHDGSLAYIFAFTPKENYERAKKAAEARPERVAVRNKSLLDQFLEDDVDAEKDFEEDEVAKGGSDVKTRNASWARRLSSLVSPTNAMQRRESAEDEALYRYTSHLDSLGLASDRMSQFDSDLDHDDSGSGSGDKSQNSASFLRKGKSLGFGTSFGAHFDESTIEKRKLKKGVYLLKKLAPNVTQLTFVCNDDNFAYQTVGDMVKAHQRIAHEVDLEVFNFRAQYFLEREARIKKIEADKLERVNRTTAPLSPLNDTNNEKGKHGEDSFRGPLKLGTPASSSFNDSMNESGSIGEASFRGPLKLGAATTRGGAYKYLDDNSERQDRLGLSWEVKGRRHADKIQLAKEKWRMNHRHIATSASHLSQLQELLWLYIAVTGKELTSRNHKMLTECLALGARKWRRCKSSNPHVQLFEGLNSTMAKADFSRSIVEVDAPPEVVLSCLLHVESNAHITNTKEDSSDKFLFLMEPRRSKLKPGTYDEQILVRVRTAFRKMKTFACRRVYSRPHSPNSDDTQCFILAFESVDATSGDRIDFGYELSAASSRNAAYSGYYRIELLPKGKSSVSRSRVTLVQSQNLNPRGLGTLHQISDKLRIDPVKELEFLRSTLDQSTTIDQEMLHSAVKIVNGDGNDWSVADVAVFDQLERNLCVDVWEGNLLRSTSLAKIEEHVDSPSLSHGEVVVQASVEEVAAWIFMAGTRERRDIYRRSDLYGVKMVDVCDLHYNVREISDQVHIFQHLVRQKGHNFYMSVKRNFRNLRHGVVEIAETDCEDSFVDMKLLKLNRIKTKALYKVTKHASLPNGTPQARIQFWCSHWTDSSSLPSNFSNKRISYELALVSDKFAKVSEIDAASRLNFIDDFVLVPGMQKLTEDEEKLIRDASLMEREFSKNPDIWHFGHRSALSEERMGCNKSHRKFHEHALWGKSTSKVKASVEEVLAFLWDFTSFAFTKEFPQEHERKVVEEVSAHTMIVSKKCDGGLEFLSKMTWKAVDDDNLVIGLEPVEHAGQSQNRRSSISRAMDALPLPHVSVSRGKSKYLDSRPSLRAKEWTLFRLTRLSKTDVKIVTVTKVLMPSQSMVNRGALQREVVYRSILTSVIIRKYFEKLLSWESYDSQEGETLGHIICDTLTTEGDFWGTNHDALLHSIMRDYKGLMELSRLYPWFPKLLVEVTKTRLKGLSMVNTGISRLSNVEATKIGQSLSLSLKARKTAESGLDQWRLNYPALVEFWERHQFAESLFLIVAKHVLRKAIWGLQWRVAIGAVLSFIDILTDIFMIAIYIKEGSMHLAYVNISMISLNLLLQASLVAFQNWKKKKLIPKELFAVFTGMKPAIDAHRVASGTEREPHQRLDPLAELTATKLAEMVAEAIPAAILQSYAYLNDGSGGPAAVASILISSCATAYMSSIISFDFDCDPENRSSYSAFYGYVPDSSQSRSLTFGAMMIYSVCTNLCRVIGSALLSTYSWWLFLGYLLADMFAFFLYKVAMRDLTHWSPAEGGWNVATTFFARFGAKLISDYTGIAQLRHPHELGPIYWLTTVIFTQVFVWIAFGTVTMGLGVKTSFDDTAMMSIIACMNVLFFVGAGTFYFSIKKEYRNTFSSTERGVDFSRKIFLEGGKNHERKMKIFEINRAHWNNLRRPVSRFVRTNWHKWKDAKVEWLTDDLILSLPAEFIPVADRSIVRTNTENRIRRRRSSMGKIVGLEVWNRRESNFLLAGSFTLGSPGPGGGRDDVANGGGGSGSGSAKQRPSLSVLTEESKASCGDGGSSGNRRVKIHVEG
ncbi:hypothetical protein TrST_g8614 [Triparma strigata]|uniref:Uncharacterized protein n=1 Tax=Triparma strigata TaxID=1606541 RepID=A0A9W7F207_9STRA|nr:hypothetical protein TrST_g8614 [Triparma strigata]